MLAYAPGITKVDLIDPHKDNSNPPGSLVSGPAVAKRSVETGDDEVGDAHSHSSGDQDYLSAESVDVEDCWDCCGEEEDTTDAAGKERCGVAREAEIFEYESRIIQYRVYSRPWALALAERQPSKGEYQSNSH